MLSLIYKKMRVIFYCQSNYPHVKTHSNVCISGEIAPRNGKQATIACTYIILLSIIIDEVDLVQEQEQRRQSALRDQSNNFIASRIFFQQHLLIQ